ncbi:sel1 repeat family protein [Aquisalinus flavus]|uniref:Beta-lactamase n=1 Tax=Aquisalinus flavus TaxID=1526572 RepID=A0A8J2V725_9PROT|nr:sel1 repeat family protein [Aquisalinus flavus]MBD0425785.1 sel1 repeat family protein [Aquisalinus flavus]UNE48608.1 sel1 repeat family protein [Aquisalinus flavus]GGD13309.1 hypothetical protein GCM10011342_22580 [Aquisalinus flavus]
MILSQLCQTARRTGILFAAAAGLAFIASAPALAQQDAEALYTQGQTLLANDNPIDGRIALRQACELDHIEACKAYGDDLNMGGFFGDTEAVRDRYWAYGRACDLGDGEACLKLGDARAPIGLFSAPRTPENWAGAAAAYRRACDEHRIAEGCTRAGAVLGDNSNPDRDAMASLTYRDRACELGSQTACDASANERAVANVRAREAAAVEEHERLYGTTDSRVPVGQAFYDVLAQILQSDGRTTWSEAKVTALRGHILADGVVDGEERDLIVEMTFPRLRVFVIYPSSQPDPFSGDSLSTTPVRDEALRSSLLALLDYTPADLSWDETDRPGTMRRLFDASLHSPELAAPAQAVIAEQVARLAAASTVENAYGPLRGFITEAMGVVNTYEGEDNAAVRGLLYDAIVEGVEGAPLTMPRFLYNWIRPGGYGGPERPRTP